MTTQALTWKLRQLLANDISHYTFSATAAPTPPDLTDVDLGLGPKITKNVSPEDVILNQSANTTYVNCSLTTAEGNGKTWTEIGLFAKDGTLIGKDVFTQPELKNSAKTLSVNIEILGEL